MSRAMHWMAYAAPWLAVLTLLAIYLVAPRFYLAYVLEIRRRESQAVEMATVLLLGVAVVTLAWSSWRLWREARRARAGRTDPEQRESLGRFAAASFVTGIFAAALFFLGEEVNWGQTFLLWIDPAHHLPVQTNVHNNIPLVSVQGIGSMCVALAFVGVPLAWVLRDRWNPKLPDNFRPAVAEGPIVACLAVAFAIKWVKDLYRSAYAITPGDTFYWGFLEQVNEQKEMLVALSFALYGLYRLAAVRRKAQASAPARMDERMPATAAAPHAR
jgi:hypothetical protein